MKVGGFLGEMGVRVGLGPVFFYEWLLASRRWQLYAGRALFVFLILAVLFFVWLAHVVDNPPQTLQDQAKLGATFFFSIIGTQLALVLLAAPAATAGSVCIDKARGTLTHLLVTDLSSSEIVLGKLAARLLPVLGLLLCALPVLALNTLLGGIDPEALASAFLITVGVAVLGCVLALVLSVWGRQTHEVLLLNYLLWTVYLLAYPICLVIAEEVFGVRTLPSILYRANPFWLAFAPYHSPGTTGLLDALVFLGVCLALAAGLAAAAVWAVRRVTVSQLGQAARHARRPGWGFVFHRSVWALFSPSLNANPVLWREWHRKRPSRWMLLIWLVYAVLGGGWIALALVNDAVQVRRGGGPHDEMGILGVGLLVLVGLLLVSVTASTSLAEERARGSLDVLLTTPLTTRSIVWGKWWGAFRTVPLLAVLPGVLAAGYTVLERPAWEALVLVPLILAYGAAITSLGLAMATWVPRLGRAVAYTVIVYVLAAVGSPFVVMAFFSSDDILGPGLAEVSPFFGSAFLIARLQRSIGDHMDSVGYWAIFWTLTYLVAAAVLYFLALLTFNQHLGRTATTQERFVPVSPPRPALRHHAGTALAGPRRATDDSTPVAETSD
jgi:ABC-type transport system involved in multi-copper enzyme maturation permease subunit